MNRGIRVLQTHALPLGYVAITVIFYEVLRENSSAFEKSHMDYAVSMQLGFLLAAGGIQRVTI